MPAGQGQPDPARGPPAQTLNQGMLCGAVKTNSPSPVGGAAGPPAGGGGDVVLQPSPTSEVPPENSQPPGQANPAVEDMQDGPHFPDMPDSISRHGRARRAGQPGILH
jgi:hypothetical protein